MQAIMQYIYEIYRRRSFTAAAGHLFISQPALSAAVRRYEQQLGIRLFDRSTRTVTLTEAGRIYIRGVEKLMAVENDMFEQLENLSRLETGRLRLGAVPFAAACLLPSLLGRFSGSNPAIRVEVTEGTGEELCALLQNEQLDLVLDYGFDDKIFSAEKVENENILLCVPEKTAQTLNIFSKGRTAEEICHNGTAGMAEIDASVFRREKFVLLRQGNDLHTRAYQMCMERSFVPDTVLEVDQLMTCYALSRSGMGVTFVTDSLLRSSGHQDGCLFYLPDSEKNVRTLYAAKRKNSYSSRAADEFLKSIAEQKADVVQS